MCALWAPLKAEFVKIVAGSEGVVHNLGRDIHGKYVHTQHCRENGNIFRTEQ